MTNGADSLELILANLRACRERAGLSEADIEERLILGPGWISRFETGETVPSIDLLLAIVSETGANVSDLIAGLPEHVEHPEIERSIYAVQAGNDIDIHFRYANFDAVYTLAQATEDQFDEVIKTMRDNLSRLAGADANIGEAIKTEAVASTFLSAVETWPNANPSDLWWFVVYRAYCDPYNHPAQFARLDFTQSWKRTGGWALEEVLVRHYRPFLNQNGVDIFIADGITKQMIVDNIDVGDRIEADKIDVVLTGIEDNRFFGVVHVKASFAERRTDDVPMSSALARSGYTSPLWTMDCKSGPATQPVNRGELGRSDGNRSAKRRDIEDEGYFTGCFSYNRNTEPSQPAVNADNRIYVCDFSNPNDAFSQYILSRWNEFRPA